VWALLAMYFQMLSDVLRRQVTHPHRPETGCWIARNWQLLLQRRPRWL